MNKREFIQQNHMLHCKYNSAFLEPNYHETNRNFTKIRVFFFELIKKVNRFKNKIFLIVTFMSQKVLYILWNDKRISGNH
jgi:hypothetical protein